MSKTNEYNLKIDAELKQARMEWMDAQYQMDEALKNLNAKLNEYQQTLGSAAQLIEEVEEELTEEELADYKEAYSYDQWKDNQGE